MWGPGPLPEDTRTPPPDRPSRPGPRQHSRPNTPAHQARPPLHHNRCPLHHKPPARAQPRCRLTLHPGTQPCPDIRPTDSNGNTRSSPAPRLSSRRSHYPPRRSSPLQAPEPSTPPAPIPRRLALPGMSPPRSIHSSPSQSQCCPVPPRSRTHQQPGDRTPHCRTCASPGSRPDLCTC